MDRNFVEKITVKFYEMFKIYELQNRNLHKSFDQK